MHRSHAPSPPPPFCLPHPCAPLSLSVLLICSFQAVSHRPPKPKLHHSRLKLLRPPLLHPHQEQSLSYHLATQIITGQVDSHGRHAACAPSAMDGPRQPLPSRTSSRRQLCSRMVFFLFPCQFFPLSKIRAP